MGRCVRWAGTWAPRTGRDGRRSTCRSGQELGVEVTQLVTAGAAPVLHRRIELADALAAAADVDHEVVEGLAERAELGGLLDLDPVEQWIDHVLGLASHPLRGGLDVVVELHLSIDDRVMRE